MRSSPISKPERLLIFISGVRHAYSVAREVISRLARKVLDKALVASITHPRHVLLVRWDGKLGDTIVSSFFIREILKLNSVLITVVTSPALADYYRSIHGVSDVLVTRENPGLLRMLRLRDQLAAVDTIVHLVGRIRVRELIFFRLLSPRNLFSLDDGLALVNGKMREATAGSSFGMKYARVLQQLGLSHPDVSPSLPFKAPSMQEFAPARMVLFNPFGSRRGKSIQNYKAISLLKLLADHMPDTEIAIMHQAITRNQAEMMRRQTGRLNVTLAPHVTTLSGLAETIASAIVVVSVDTGIVHLADTLRQRLVAIYPAANPVHNPWLPRPAHTTRIVYSNRQQHVVASKGLKNLNDFDERKVLAHTLELAAERVEKREMSLRAELISGLGVASRNLSLQLPLIGVHAPEIVHCHPGTINIRCERAFIVTGPDITTPELAWVPGSERVEAFSLLRVQLSLSGQSERIPAWIYVPQHSPHRDTPAVHEVLAPRLLLGDAASVTVHLNSQQVQLL